MNEHDTRNREMRERAARDIDQKANLESRASAMWAIGFVIIAAVVISLIFISPTPPPTQTMTIPPPDTTIAVPPPPSTTGTAPAPSPVTPR